MKGQGSLEFISEKLGSQGKSGDNVKDILQWRWKLQLLYYF